MSDPHITVSGLPQEQPRLYCTVSEKPRNNSVFINVDFFCRRNLGKTGHSHYIARECNDKACTCRYLDVFNGDRESVGSAELCRVVREAVLRFCHTYRDFVEAQSGELLYLLLCFRQKRYSVSAVYFFDDGFNFFFYANVRVIAECEVVFFFAKPYDLFGKLCAAVAALCPNVG